MTNRSKNGLEIDQFFNNDFPSILTPFWEVLGEVLGGFWGDFGLPGGLKSDVVMMSQGQQRPRWSREAIWGTILGPQSCPAGPQEARKRLPGGSQGRSRGSQELPKMGQLVAKVPRGAKEAPKTPQELSRGPQEGPRGTPEGPKGVSSRPKSAPRGSTSL